MSQLVAVLKSAIKKRKTSKKANYSVVLDDHSAPYVKVKNTDQAIKTVRINILC